MRRTMRSQQALQWMPCMTHLGRRSPRETTPDALSVACSDRLPHTALSTDTQHERVAWRFRQACSALSLCSFSPAQSLRPEHRAPYATMRASSGRMKRFACKEASVEISAMEGQTSPFEIDVRLDGGSGQSCSRRMEAHGAHSQVQRRPRAATYR